MTKISLGMEKKSSSSYQQRISKSEEDCRTPNSEQWEMGQVEKADAKALASALGQPFCGLLLWYSADPFHGLLSSSAIREVSPWQDG